MRDVSTTRMALLLALGVSTAGCAGEAGNESIGITPDGEAFPLYGCNAVGAVGYEGSGYEECEGGFIHRTAPTQCRSGLPREAGPSVAEENGWECSRDADCMDSPHGHCEWAPDESGGYCHYGCLTDDDCSDNQVCLCGEVIGECVSAHCRSDADCAGDALCTRTTYSSNCGETSFTCQSPRDECSGDQCECIVSSEGHMMCDQENQCYTIGRPFLVDSQPRLAPTCSRRDWSMDMPPVADPLSEDERNALTSHWRQIARMEHASIAAFARFSLQLLALGAPAELIERTNAALADETRHARAAFSLASRFGQSAMGPDCLSLEDALEQASLEQIVVDAVLEGCIGETLASLEAAEALETATDPQVAQTLAEVARDELRHAELAWSFVSWALETFGERLRGPLEGAFERGIQQALRSDGLGAQDDSLAGFGLVCVARLARVRRTAVGQVIAPCRDALLSRFERSAAAVSARDTTSAPVA